jgi:hypothetical protein
MVGTQRFLKFCVEVVTLSHEPTYSSLLEAINAQIIEVPGANSKKESSSCRSRTQTDKKIV